MTVASHFNSAGWNAISAQQHPCGALARTSVTIQICTTVWFQYLTVVRNENLHRPLVVLTSY